MEQYEGSCGRCDSKEFGIEYNKKKQEIYIYCRSCLWPIIRIDKNKKAFVNEEFIDTGD